MNKIHLKLWIIGMVIPFINFIYMMGLWDSHRLHFLPSVMMSFTKQKVAAQND